jgi:hypothetical protein
MSWGKEQFKKAYNRAKGKQEVNEDHPDYDHIYGYWDGDSCCDYHDNQAPTMEDIAEGRLFSLLTKLKIRGAKVILDNIWW